MSTRKQANPLSTDAHWDGRAKAIIRQYDFNNHDWDVWSPGWVYLEEDDVHIALDNQDDSEAMEALIQPAMHRCDHHCEIKCEHNTSRSGLHFFKYFYRLTPIRGDMDKSDIELMNV